VSPARGKTTDGDGEGEAARRLALALAYIERELADLEREAPKEGTEAAVFTLVAVRHVLWGHEAPIVKAHERFVDEINGEPTKESLTTVLRLEGIGRDLPRILGDFARWVAAMWPPRTN
jgi:hypothetical protein